MTEGPSPEPPATFRIPLTLPGWVPCTLDQVRPDSPSAACLLCPPGRNFHQPTVCPSWWPGPRREARRNSPELVPDALQLMVGHAQVQGHSWPVRAQAPSHIQQVALGQEAGLRIAQVQRCQGENRPPSPSRPLRPPQPLRGRRHAMGPGCPLGLSTAPPLHTHDPPGRTGSLMGRVAIHRASAAFLCRAASASLGTSSGTAPR